jgi:hypothetical protein
MRNGSNLLKQSAWVRDLAYMTKAIFIMFTSKSIAIVLQDHGMSTTRELV